MGSVAVVVVVACVAPSRPASRLAVDPDSVEDGRLRSPPGPVFAEQPGREALLRWVGACRDVGVTHHPEVFRKAGTVVVQWVADRNGELMQLEFQADSYRGWEVRPEQSFSECVVARARGSALRWSRTGTAPLRLGPVDAPPPGFVAADAGEPGAAADAAAPH